MLRQGRDVATARRANTPSFVRNFNSDRGRDVAIKMRLSINLSLETKKLTETRLPMIDSDLPLVTWLL